MLNMSIDHCINVIQSLTDDFISVNDDQAHALVEAGKKCPKFAVTLTSIVFNQAYTELKYSGSDQVLKRWLQIILGWICEPDTNPNWLYSVFMWKFNSRNYGGSSVNGISLAPIFEVQYVQE